MRERVTVVGTSVFTSPSVCSEIGLFKRAWKIPKVMPRPCSLASNIQRLELSNEVLYDPVPQGAVELKAVKF